MRIRRRRHWLPASDWEFRRRGDSVPTKLLSVTVSMGAAQPEFERQPSAQVLKAADEALYRAKKGGRNRVST